MNSIFGKRLKNAAIFIKKQSNEDFTFGEKNCTDSTKIVELLDDEFS